METTTDEILQGDLRQWLETDMVIPIPEPTLTTLLASPPFLAVPGILNFRDLGVVAPSYIRPGLLFRSGSISAPLSPSSVTILQETFGVKAILDLRSEGEVLRMPDPQIEGVENLWVKCEKEHAMIPLHEFHGKAKEGYVKVNGNLLDAYGGSVREALNWVRDEKGPLLFHCTAGKDRTGVIAAIMLALAGAPRDLIAHDYALSRIGIEPGREVLMQMMKLWNKDYSVETPGMKDSAQIKAEFMEATLEMVDEKYGGVEGYVKGLGFSDEDLARIRDALKENAE